MKCDGVTWFDNGGLQVLHTDPAPEGWVLVLEEA